MTLDRFLLPLISALIVAFLTFGMLALKTEEIGRSHDFVMRLPGMDEIPEGARDLAANVKIGEFFEKFTETPATSLTGRWSGLRGDDSRNIVNDGIALIESFSDSAPPPALYKIALGEGHAAPAIYDGLFYILDYLESEKADALRCFDLLTGKELWRRYYTIDIKRNHGYSRTVPAVNAGQVVSIGPFGQVMCVDRLSGDLLWSLDMVERYKTTIPQWYTGQCPLMTDDILILAPAGEKALMVAIKPETGEVLWETPNPGGLKMSHASVVPMSFKGQNMYVYTALGGIAGVAADGEQAGQILWQTADWGATVVAPSPVILPDGRIYQSAGYGAGSVVVRLDGSAPPFRAEFDMRFNPRQALATEQQTAILHENILFGVMTKDAGTRRMMLVAADAADPSKFLFNGDARHRYGLGPLLMADDRIFALADDGQLSMLKFVDGAMQDMGQAQVLQGVDAWGPLAMADGLMLLRDSTTMICLDLTADSRWVKEKNK